MKHLCLLIGSILLFTGCTSSNIALGDYPQTIPMKKSPFAPSRDDLSSKGMSVVVLNIDDHLNATSKEANLGYSIASELSSQLVQTKRVEVLKRLDKPVFLKELQQYELSEKYDVDLEKSDYLLTGQITDAKFRNRFHPEERRTQGGHTPSWAAYQACIKGTINLFKLPSLKIKKVFPFEECSQESEPVLRPKEMKQKSPELVRGNISDVLDTMAPQIKKYFKPQGYIYAMRSNGSDKIIQTTLNKGLGAKEGSTVDIIKIEKKTNPLTGKMEVIKDVVGLGVISSLITEEYSFILVKQLDADLSIGDMVQVSN